MRPDFILFPRGFMHKSGSINGKLPNLGGQRNRTNDDGTIALGRIDNRLRGNIYNLIIIGADLDSDFLVSIGRRFFLCFSFCRCHNVKEHPAPLYSGAGCSLTL